MSFTKRSIRRSLRNTKPGGVSSNATVIVYKLFSATVPIGLSSSHGAVPGLLTKTRSPTSISLSGSASATFLNFTKYLPPNPKPCDLPFSFRNARPFSSLSRPLNRRISSSCKRICSSRSNSTSSLKYLTYSLSSHLMPLCLTVNKR